MGLRMSDPRWRRAAAVVLVAAACSRPQPAPAPAPAPDTAAAVAAPRPAVAPARVAGTYNLQAIIQGRAIPAPVAPPRRGRARTTTAPPTATLQLSAIPVAAPDPTASSTTQLAGTVALPGYTMAPRGRTVQAASWWPAGGDSVVVHWVTPRNVALTLRGTVRGDTLSGDIWYTSLDSGAEFQLGTFTAVRRRTGR